jgi:hypothetical protein
MRLGNTVVFTHLALGLFPEILNAINVIVVVCEELRMVDTEVMKVQHIKYIIAVPAFGMNNTIHNHLASMVVGGGIAVNPIKPYRCSRHRYDYEMLNQTALFVLT